MAGFNKQFTTEQIDSYGTTADVWDDIPGQLAGKRLFSVVGSVDYDYSEAAVLFSGGGDVTDDNDVVVAAVQYPHKAILGVGACLRPHIHFEQTTANSIVFTMQYRIQKNNALKTTTWTTVTATVGTDTVWDWTSGTLNNILQFPEIDMSNADLSSTIQFRITRSDTTGGTVRVTFMDMHVPFDTIGSMGEYNKR